MCAEKSFSDRYSLSEQLADRLFELFEKNEVELIPYGMEKISYGYDALKMYLNSANANFSHSAMMIKFAPDFILLKKKQPQSMYFLEIKVSTTPLWAKGSVQKIRDKSPDIKLSDIGIIARDAWNAYKTLYPKAIILAASTYNPNVLKAQFVEDIICLRCHGKNEDENCDACPVKKKEFFEYSRNHNARGSQTQHTNLDLSSFLSINEFFEKLDIQINDNCLNEIKDYFKSQGIDLPPQLTEKDKLAIVRQLKNEGCDWL